MTDLVYDDQHPNGRPATSGTPVVNGENYRLVTEASLDDTILAFTSRLDRIENLLATILGHVEPQNIQINSDFLKGIQGEDQ